MEEFEKAAAKASKEGAQFACSQTTVDENDPQWQNSLDINIPSFNISAAGKVLFKDAALNIAHGHRIGVRYIHVCFVIHDRSGHHESKRVRFSI